MILFLNLIKELESLLLLALGVVMLANTDINNNSEVDSNIDESKEDEFGVSLNTKP